MREQDLYYSVENVYGEKLGAEFFPTRETVPLRVSQVGKMRPLTKLDKPLKSRGFKKRSHREFLEEVLELTGFEYTVLSIYEGANTKVLIRHNRCGTRWKVNANNFLRGSRCPACAHKGFSKLSNKVASWLDSQNISYKREVRFNSCRDTFPLPFDFALLDNSGKIMMLLEVDGKQHSQSVDYFGGEESFRKVKKHDNIKENFCKDNGIPFRRIDYKELL